MQQLPHLGGGWQAGKGVRGGEGGGSEAGACHGGCPPGPESSHAVVGESTSYRGSGCTNSKELLQEGPLVLYNKNYMYLRCEGPFLIHAKALCTGRGLGLGQVLRSPPGKGNVRGSLRGCEG